MQAAGERRARLGNGWVTTARLFAQAPLPAEFLDFDQTHGSIFTVEFVDQTRRPIGLFVHVELR
jgi:hypothetical protein